MELNIESINEVEFCLLKLLLSKQNLQEFIIEHCESEFFEDALNRKIFDASKELYSEEKQIDNVGVYYKIGNADVSDRLTDILIKSIAYPFAVKKYCKLLSDRHLEKLIKQANSAEDFEHINKFKEKYIIEDTKIKCIGDDIKNFTDRYEQRKNSMILTTWNNLDNCIGSFCGGDYIALGGSTGTGKTTIALNIAKNLCMQDKAVLYCSLEMPLEQLQNRFNCMITQLSAMKYRSCGFTQEEYEIYKEGLKMLNQWKLNVVCDYDLTIEKLKYYALEQQKTELDFIIIDYLGLMAGYGNKSLYEKSTILSRQIKLLATELNVPILVLVQLNRGLADRKDKRPILSDIRESGAIEQDADYVLFAYRDYIYSQDEFKKEELEIIVAKNRHGESNAICKFDFDLKCQLIKNKKYF